MDLRRILKSIRLYIHPEKPKLNRYGWKRGLPHAGHKKYAITSRDEALPLSVDHRSKCPPVYDQGELGSCSANATVASIQFEQAHHGIEPNYVPSRLFQYFNTRLIEGTVNSDSGATIADAIKAVSIYGFCPEKKWPYNIRKFTKKPPKSLYDEAKGNAIPDIDYSSVNQSAYDLKCCLAAGNCVIFGFSVYESFESDEVAKTGVVSMPNPSSEEFMGGHAVLLVGYDDDKQHFIVRNSWGPNWGDNGYCYFPYSYLLDPNLADDFWCIKTINGAKK